MTPHQTPDELDRRAKALLADPWNDDARDEAMTLRALAAEAREWAREWGGVGVGMPAARGKEVAA